MKKQLH